MSTFSFPSTTCFTAASNSLPLISQASYLSLCPFLRSNQHKTACISGNAPSPHIHQPLIQRVSSSASRQRGESLVPFNAKSSSGSGEEEHRALETVLKLYSAIKNQNVRELSDIIGDECRCVSNFISYFQPLQGKKQVLGFLIHVIRFLGNNVELIVKPTLHDGMNVGVAWRLEWNETHVPLGKGFSFHVCQAYHGKVLIRNMEMFMEPLLHLEPFRLKIMGYMMNIVDKMSSYTMLKGEKNKAFCILFTLLFMAAILFFSKPGLY